VGGGRRGSWKSEVLEACSLQFLEARTKCLEVVAEVPLQTQLKIPTMDLGYRSLEKLTDTLQAIHDRDKCQLDRLFPDFRHRSRILKSALPLLPEEESDYSICVKTRTSAVDLVSDVRVYIKSISREESAESLPQQVQTITGVLYLIEVATGQRQLGVIVSNRHIRCFYPPEFEETVRELIPGSLVEVEGFATLNDRGEVDRIEEIIDVRPIQLVPLYWSRIVYSRRFILKNPIRILPDVLDGVWVHEYEPLGIIAYGRTRSESLEAFRMEFAVLWDEYGQEDDQNLTEDAKELKSAIKNLVSLVEVP
jgi:hypothetical protein